MDCGGLPSNQKISTDTEQEAIAILSRPVYRGFKPTLDAEYLAKKHDINVSCQTMRRWMMGAKLWRARKQHIEKIYEWRPAGSRPRVDHHERCVPIGPIRPTQ
jgi:hypothetical protein